MREPPHEPIGSIVDTDIEAIEVAAPLLSVTRRLATYNLLALPVVDAEKRLLGAVSVDDVIDHLLPEDWREQDDEEHGLAGAPTTATTWTGTVGGGRPGVSRG